MNSRTFAAWMTHRHYSPATIRVYLSYVQRADAAVGPLERAGRRDLYDWWATLPRSSSSRNGARKALVAFYRSRGGRNPAVKLPQLPAPPGRPRPVAQPTFVALQTAAARLGGEHHTLAVLLASTGCRIGEARVARWDTFAFDGEPPTWTITGKGSRRTGPKLRDVALHATAVTVLRGWRRECPSRVWVFPSPRLSGRPVTDGTVRRRVYEIADTAGVDDHVNPHRWRHTFATAALNTTKDLGAVQDFLGHADPATTRRYTSTAVARMVAVADAAVAYGTPQLHAVS